MQGTNSKKRKWKSRSDLPTFPMEIHCFSDFHEITFYFTAIGVFDRESHFPLFDFVQWDTRDFHCRRNLEFGGTRCNDFWTLTRGGVWDPRLTLRLRNFEMMGGALPPKTTTTTWASGRRIR